MALSVMQQCRKRKRNPKMIGCEMLSDDDCPPMNLSGPFRDNIRSFLRDFCDPEDYSVSGNPVWSTLLVSHSNGVVFPLFFLEESVHRSPNPLCDICRCVGWSHHFVSLRRYHMIIPREADWNKPLKRDVLNLQTHLLHGLVHCNGFGHLLRITGTDDHGGSNCFRREEIMDLWDRICTTLQTRKITVDDAGKQGSMELRLLHGVAFGRSWFGRWGYKFCHGRFGVTEQKYNRAIEVLNSLDLNRVLSDFHGTEPGRAVHRIVSTYRAMTDSRLTTVSDLLQFMLLCKSKSPIQRKTDSALAEISVKQQKAPPSPGRRKRRGAVEEGGEHPEFEKVAPKLESRYPIRRLVQAARVIVEVLAEHKLKKAAGGGNMCRQEVRDAIRAHIGDTGLIDFTLKNIHNTVVGGRIVRRVTNPETRVLEFSVEGVGEAEEEEEEEEDIEYIYRKVLLGYSEVGWAVRVVADSNQLVKEWGAREDGRIRLVCRYMPTYEELDGELTRALPPGEVLVVPQSTTTGELKEMAQRALRDTYCIMEGVEVTDVRVGEWSAGGEVTCAVEAWSEMWVRGRGLDMDTPLRYEGGAEGWVVHCGGCGATDDDGERMVACDTCQVWQHTACNSIQDAAPPPNNFLCHKCTNTSTTTT